MSKVSKRHQVFIREYLKDGNGARSAVAAGYSANGAKVTAHRLLTNANVRSELAKVNEKINDKLEVSVERVRHELARLAFLDPRSFYHPDGSLKQIPELDDDTAAALAGMEVEKLYDHFGKGQAAAKGTITKIKFADKGQNLERLGRHLKMFTDKIEFSALDELAEMITKARARAG